MVSSFACDISLDFRKAVINVSHNDVSASIVFQTDCKYLLEYIPFSFLSLPRNQVQISSSAIEQAKPAPEMPYTTGLVLGMYKSLTNDTELDLLCIFYFSLGIIKT